MPTYPILFNQTPESLRRIGARGGRAHARKSSIRRHLRVDLCGANVEERHRPGKDRSAQY